MSTQTARDIIREISDWADYNWPPEQHAPDLGVVEEIGETTHCILKRIQKIRGMDDVGKFMDKVSDGFADAGVYLCHFCGKNNLTLSFNSTSPFPPFSSDRQALIYILQNVIAILQYTETAGTKLEMQELAQFPAQRIWNGLNAWAAKYNISLEEELHATWAKVKLRNWKKNPTDAHQVAESK